MFNSLFLMALLIFHLEIYHIFFIHSPVDTLVCLIHALGYFIVPPLVAFGACIFLNAGFAMDISPELGWQDHMVGLK